MDENALDEKALDENWAHGLLRQIKSNEWANITEFTHVTQIQISSLAIKTSHASKGIDWLKLTAKIRKSFKKYVA